MLGIEFTGTVPFSYIYLHGLIRDSQVSRLYVYLIITSKYIYLGNNIHTFLNELQIREMFAMRLGGHALCYIMVFFICFSPLIVL